MSERGLYPKYVVRRTDGRDGQGQKHADCEYFVLDVDHDDYAAVALRAYANACRSVLPELARDLEDRAASRSGGATPVDALRVSGVIADAPVGGVSRSPLQPALPAVNGPAVTGVATCGCQCHKPIGLNALETAQWSCIHCQVYGQCTAPEGE